MRRTWTRGFIGAALLIECSGGSAGAEEPAPAGSPGTGAAAVPGPESKGPTAKEWLAKLDGTTWAIELVLVGDPGTRLQDEIAFQGQRVTSQMLSQEGYPTTNVSLRAMPDGTAVWETMMSKPGEGLVFLRGDLQGDTMQGMMSRQPEGHKASDYAFSAKQTASAPPPSTSAASESAPESGSAGASTPAAEQPTAEPGASVTTSPETPPSAPATAPAASPAPSGQAAPADKPAGRPEKAKKRRWF